MFDGDWVTIGMGAGYSPSYTGSDDYRPFPLPIVQGELAGIGFSPLGPGLALDFLTGEEKGLDISLGPAFRLRSDRADDIEDPIVELAGELDRAVEVGVAAGITKRGIGTRRDSLSFNLGARADVAGAHDGIIVEPSISYFAPLDRGTVVSFSLNASIIDDNYADYYFSVSPAQSAVSGLPQFSADGGLQSVGTSVFIAYDLDGNALNGGLSAVFIGSYSRLLGDAADTPYTSLRGNADQLFAGVGLGYTF
ncbi:MAG: MipA/OmpV family protein [Erythrobacter sp.]